MKVKKEKRKFYLIIFNSKVDFMKLELKEISEDEAVKLGLPYNYVLAVDVDKKEKPDIIGLGWLTFVSWNPRMIVISISRERYFHECIEHCKEFVLCFPS